MINVRERWLVAGALCLILWPAVSCTQDVRWEKMMSLGEKALQEGRLARAEKYFLEALSEAENSGASEELLAASLNNLAAVYRAQGKYAQAEPLYLRALGIYETALGPEHPDVATSINNMAALYHSQGKYAEAEPLYQRALAITEKALGPEHPDVATTLENYADLLRKLERDAEAEEMEERAKAIRAKRDPGRQ